MKFSELPIGRFFKYQGNYYLKVITHRQIFCFFFWRTKNSYTRTNGRAKMVFISPESIVEPKMFPQEDELFAYFTLLA